MNNYTAYHKYIESEGIKLFTVVVLPNSEGKFPTVVERGPYVDSYEDMAEDDVVAEYLKGCYEWLEKGYAMIFQHCRGRGKSNGDCIPYINERADGLALLEWIRKQDFYNGEIFLRGGSYRTTVHYATAPFAEDIKGAYFAVQDSARYNICYRNGFFKKGLHGNWYVNMYKKKSHMKKNFTSGSFDLLPLKDFTKTAFGESSEDFDEMLKYPNKNDKFWNTHMGGTDTRNATDDVHFPILFTTAFNDIYTGGVFDMWSRMSAKSKSMSALVVSPYNHGDNHNQENTIVFPNGAKSEQFGENTDLDWFEFIRGKKEKSPFEQGKITYYRLFENIWKTEESLCTDNKIKIQLGEKEVSYTYNPYDPPRFKGGLSRAFGGAVYQDSPNSRHDIISVYTSPFAETVFVKGKISAKLSVKSDCEDTCFYIRISNEKTDGDFGLRDDITSLCYQLGDYTPNTVVELDFEFDEHAFQIKKGERLRIDLASAENENYVRHTNQKGLFSEQTTAKIAHNTIYLQNSSLTLPIE